MEKTYIIEFRNGRTHTWTGNSPKNALIRLIETMYREQNLEVGKFSSKKKLVIQM